jgi:hypothetical protein
MSVALQKVIADLERQLSIEMQDSEYYHRKWKESELKVIALKESLLDLKELEEKI